MRIGIILSLIMMIGIMINPFKTSKTKITDIDKKIDEELKELLKEGKKIQAIRILREKTGMGLKEAKEYVDHLE